ncbi:hypothetical protein [Nocardioides litoris]|uniref:hypothetical protein n=1 Tax=Nocardioides litoris TaxID=1926648 RepID=UPI00111D9E94|nr:hypothetical protein [Nocardioides litoris]
MLSRNAWIGIIASVVVVAAAIGLLQLVRTVGEDELSLPPQVDDLLAVDSEAFLGTSGQEDLLATRRAEARTVGESLSEAFDGAAAVTRVYVDRESAESVTVFAVAADAGPLLPPGGFVDPDRAGLALPPVERVADDGVECLLQRNNPPRAGTDYQPDQAAPDTVQCQRRSGTLTVRAQATFGDRDRVEDVVDDVWDDLD